jgi:hypothetical protein
MLMINDTMEKDSRELFTQVIERTEFPLSEVAKVRNIVCEDGSRRTYTATNSADTFFSIPGYVQVNGTSVRGYATTDTVWDDELNREFLVWKFIAYKYCKNWRMLQNV